MGRYVPYLSISSSSARGSGLKSSSSESPTGVGAVDCSSRSAACEACTMGLYNDAFPLKGPSLFPLLAGEPFLGFLPGLFLSLEGPDLSAPLYGPAGVGPVGGISLMSTPTIYETLDNSNDFRINLLHEKSVYLLVIHQFQLVEEHGLHVA